MSKIFKIFSIFILVFLVVFGIYVAGAYNQFVAKDEGVKTAWSQVENQYQRRLDLIPNLVNTVKAYSIHEADTLEAVVNARSKAIQPQINLSDSQSFSKFQLGQDLLSSSLSKLMLVVEKYPDLKADKSFLELQAQLEGSENRISVERKKYNEVVRVYNIMIRQFPKRLIASIFGFDKANLFESTKGSDVPPVVDFKK